MLFVVFVVPYLILAILALGNQMSLVCEGREILDNFKLIFKTTLIVLGLMYFLVMPIVLPSRILLCEIVAVVDFLIALMISYFVNDNHP